MLRFLAKKFAPKGAVFGFGGGEVERRAEVVGVARAGRDQLVDHAPIGQATHLAVVDKKIRLEFAAADRRAVHLLVGVVAVHGEKLHPALAAVLHGLLQQCPLAHRPKNQAVAVALEHLERGGGKGDLLADRGVFVLDDRAVEINCYGHATWLFVAPPRAFTLLRSKTNRLRKDERLVGGYNFGALRIYECADPQLLSCVRRVVLGVEYGSDAVLFVANICKNIQF